MNCKNPNINNPKFENLFQKAFECHQTGDLELAERHYQKVVNMQPEHIDVLFLLGTLNLQRRNFEAANMFLKKALKLKPDHAAAYANLGNVLKEQGKFNEAIENYNRVIELKPDCADVYFNIGNTFRELGEYGKAIENYKQSVCLGPNCPEVYCNLGGVFHKSGNLYQAEKNYRHAINLKPDYAMAHNNIGNVFKEQGKLDKAISSYNMAISFKSGYAEAYYNLGNALKDRGRIDNAEDSYRRAIEYKPDYAEAHNNLGNLLQEQGRHDEALAGFNKAIMIKTDYVEAHLNRSIESLLAGNYKRAWPEYEWRLRTSDCIVHNFQQPGWNGSSLSGQTILVHAEQGMGDTFQFIRYLPLVKAKGGKVIFECQKMLFRLLQNNKSADEIVERTPDFESDLRFDVHIPLLSLPGIFGTTLENIPSKVPYISANPMLVEQWREKHKPNGLFKIGIVWAGNSKHKNNHNRSCSLADYAPLGNLPGLAFYSLQKGPESAEALKPPGEMKIKDLDNELNDFADTAAVIANMDLIISIDSSVAHLAGAMGKPVWVLLPFAPDWRWMLDRDDSPWYPGMRLFRQNKYNEWSGVFEQVKKTLICKLRIFK